MSAYPHVHRGVKERPTGLAPWVLAGFLLITFAVAGIGSLATSAGLQGWYQGLVKPAWTPPSWLFGPVWTFLYICMAVAAWRVWRLPRESAARRLALTMFMIQLALNGLWSWIFFGWQSITGGLIEIILLVVAVQVTGLILARLNKWSGLLMVPYAIWSLFAMILNFAIWQLN